MRSSCAHYPRGRSSSSFPLSRPTPKGGRRTVVTRTESAFGSSLAPHWIPSRPTNCGGSGRPAPSLRKWAKRNRCDGPDASSEPRGFEPCGERREGRFERHELRRQDTFVSPTWSAQPERLTGTGRGTAGGNRGLARGVPPGGRQTDAAATITPRGRIAAIANCKRCWPCGLRELRNGRRSVPPDKGDAAGEVVNRHTVA